MRIRGVMSFDVDHQNWKIRVGQQVYETIDGMSLEILLKNQYYESYFETDYNEWLLTIEEEVVFALRLVEEYHIRISEKELLPAFDHPEFDLPF